jgi:4-alpha-glucanotransferase
VAPGENSPYASLSAFALDPVYISLNDAEDFQAIGGEETLDPGQRAALESVRAAARVDYVAVRQLKDTALRAAFGHFQRDELARASSRAAEFHSFVEANAAWIHDYALFRALHHERHSHWLSWEPELRDRQPAALEREQRKLAGDIRFYQYLQWEADRQWRAARRAAAARGVRLKGDLPFMVSGHSADVWTHQDEFLLDATVGAPPDAFSVNGQDWGLPAYNWAVMEQNDFAWLRRRAQRVAELFDLFRVDHVVGFFRTFIWPKHEGARPHFSPSEEPEQLRLGTRLMGVFESGGARMAAEDLGTVPNFVRQALAEVGIPGYRVLRWEREWEQPGQPFRDPAYYPAASVAVSGTHDTETLAAWWEQMPIGERRAVCQIPALHSLNPETALHFDAVVHQALLEALYGAGSQYTILSIQDAFGTKERINLPGTEGPQNWTYRLPLTTAELLRDPRGLEALDRIAGCALRHHRSLYASEAA